LCDDARQFGKANLIVSPERWQQIKNIFDDALKFAPNRFEQNRSCYYLFIAIK
jgi:hypothetical protein